ncbi:MULTISPECIES: penicillin-binding transpeptidase domain-containing protein [Bacillus]|uniref:penicillin-binding transpeptidase domain-containing protein n=1 Tax=Bacillus TaxID=1386 RepID=UPI000BB6CB81|nr:MULTISPECIES: penicillin-binding transpeptidase domain-containing protein [Bacillus]
MKRIIYLAAILVTMSLLLIACNKEEEKKANPYERLSEYITGWKSYEFQQLYEEYLTVETKEEYPFEEYGDRYEHLYNVLDVYNLELTIADYEIVWEAAEEEEEISEIRIPLNLSFDTLAGRVEYSLDVPLVKEVRMEGAEEEAVEKENWYVRWDTNFILPGLEREDKVQYATLSGARGKILDEEGYPLATNTDVYDVGVVLERFDEQSLPALSKILNVSEEFIIRQYSQSWVKPDQHVPIRKFLLEDVDIVTEAQAIPGVSVLKTIERVYPFGESAAHLIGYVRPITSEQLEANKDKGYSTSSWIGQRGLEQLLEERLRPKDGKRIYIRKPDNSTRDIAKTAAQNGETITITINGSVQQKLYEQMNDEVGTASVVEPETGKVRGLVSVPSFDPNEYVMSLSNAYHQSLVDNPKQPILNRFHASYSPGSTMKLLTTIIGLNTNSVDTEKAVAIPSGGWQKDASWGSYRVTRVNDSIPSVDLETAMVVSDNIYFAMLGLDIGSNNMVEGLNKLGFGEALPFSYSLTASQISNSGTMDSEVILADSSYGQGQVLVTMTHLASLYASVVNDGVMMKPLLLEEEQSAVWVDDVVSKENAQILQQYLRKVVTEGTARSANIPNFALAGKTGTAELKTDGQGTKGKENGLFVSYDQNKPNLVTAIIIEGVEEKGGSGHVVNLTTNFYRALEENN